MSTARLSSEEIRALARMARGGVFVDRDGRGVLHGHPVIDRGTVNALSDARLIAVDRAAGSTRLTGAGRARLAVATWVSAGRAADARLPVATGSKRPMCRSAR